MTRPQLTAFERELERRLAILSCEKETDRRLPAADTAALATITIGSFAIILIVQVF
jgi:hypothetical protein